MNNLAWWCCIEGCKRKWIFADGEDAVPDMRAAGWEHGKAGWLCPEHAKNREGDDE